MRRVRGANVRARCVQALYLRGVCWLLAGAPDRALVDLAAVPAVPGGSGFVTERLYVLMCMAARMRGTREALPARARGAHPPGLSCAQTTGPTPCGTRRAGWRASRSRSSCCSRAATPCSSCAVRHARASRREACSLLTARAQSGSARSATLSRPRCRARATCAPGAARPRRSRVRACAAARGARSHARDTAQGSGDARGAADLLARVCSERPGDALAAAALARVARA
jgi:hypothetical protein